MEVFPGGKLFWFAPHPSTAVVIDLDMNDVRTAANGAVLDIFLAFAFRRIDGDDDFLAARITDVRSFVSHHQVIDDLDP